MEKFDAYEFGNFINSVKEDIRQIENGSQVFNGMMHKDRVVSEFNQIVRVIEKQFELMTKYVTELERLAEIGRATEKVFHNKTFYMKENGKLKTGIIVVTVNDLLDWAKED